MSAQALEIRHLSLSFAGLRAIDDVSFDVPAGAIIGLIGPNGAGKSSLLNCLSRIYTPQQGEARYGAEDLLRKRIHDLAPLGIMPPSLPRVAGQANQNPLTTWK